MTSTIITIRPYVEELKAEHSRSSVRVTYDADGNPCVHYPGDYNILVPGHRDIDYRQRVLDEQGVDTQVLSFTTPACTSNRRPFPSRGRG